MDDKVLYMKVMDRDEILFEGEVVSLSSVNEKGDFDVLEMHANFITLIKDKLVLRPKGGEEREIAMAHGIMKVNQDKVVVFVGSEGVLAEETAADTKDS